MFCYDPQSPPGSTSTNLRTTSACTTRRGATRCMWAARRWSTCWCSLTEVSASGRYTLPLADLANVPADALKGCFVFFPRWGFNLSVSGCCYGEAALLLCTEELRKSAKLLTPSPQLITARICCLHTLTWNQGPEGWRDTLVTRV